MGYAQGREGLRAGQERAIGQLSPHPLDMLAGNREWKRVRRVGRPRSERRAESREATLRRLVPDRRCPGCGRTVLASRSWVVSDDRGSATCRSCWQKAR